MESLEEQIKELEVLFAYRYTVSDEEFMRTVNTPLAAPPCIDNWQTKPKRQWDRNRGGSDRGGRGGRPYDNRNRDRGGYHGNNHNSAHYRSRDSYDQSQQRYDNGGRNYNQQSGYHHQGGRYDDRQRQDGDRNQYGGAGRGSHYSDRNHPYDRHRGSRGGGRGYRGRGGQY